MQTRLVNYRGYKLTDRRISTQSDGTTGLEMTYDYEREGHAYMYAVRLVVKGRRVYCVEVAGEKELIEPQWAAIRQAVDRWPLS